MMLPKPPSRTWKVSAPCFGTLAMSMVAMVIDLWPSLQHQCPCFFICEARYKKVLGILYKMAFLLFGGMVGWEVVDLTEQPVCPPHSAVLSIYVGL